VSTESREGGESHRTLSSKTISKRGGGEEDGASTRGRHQRKGNPHYLKSGGVGCVGGGRAWFGGGGEGGVEGGMGGGRGGGGGGGGNEGG